MNTTAHAPQWSLFSGLFSSKVGLRRPKQSGMHLKQPLNSRPWTLAHGRAGFGLSGGPNPSRPNHPIKSTKRQSRPRGYDINRPHSRCERFHDMHATGARTGTAMRLLRRCLRPVGLRAASPSPSLALSTYTVPAPTQPQRTRPSINLTSSFNLHLAMRRNLLVLAGGSERGTLSTRPRLIVAWSDRSRGRPSGLRASSNEKKI